MTFSELVINARYRLQDVYTTTGSIITDATSDGIRWSSARLQTICKSAVSELQRSLMANKESRKHVDIASFVRELTGFVIKTSSGMIDFSSNELSNIARVLSVVEASDSEHIYSYIEPDKFLQKKYYASKSPTLEERVFTGFYDDYYEQVSYYCLPIPSSGNVSINVMVEYSLDTFLSTSSSSHLPFIGADDLLLDFVEKQARREERDVESLKLLLLDIDKKVRELRGDLQGNN